MSEAGGAAAEGEEDKNGEAKRAEAGGRQETAGGGGGGKMAGVVEASELDVGNETALEESFNTATDCDALEAMYQRVLAKNRYGQALCCIGGRATRVSAACFFP